jgi:NAD(P)-dependent dehydrogenase (short-subunit alcohol dehydrogenase family)
MTHPHTPFGFTSTADEVLAGVDLTGTRALVTGASTGIGFETARALAGARAAVVLGVRNLDAGKDAATRISESTGNQDVSVGGLDLADLGSVRAFVAAWHGPLHMLVNNAGVMALPELTRTASPLLAGMGGRYFEDCKEAPVLEERPPLFGGGVAPYALDPANAQRLWDVATRLVS